MPVALARAVLDTNVILSAALSPRGAPAEVVDRLLAQALLVVTGATFAELESRIWKPSSTVICRSSGGRKFCTA